MKTSTRIRSQVARPSAFVLAILVFGLVLSCSGRALAVGTTPNASLVSYVLAAGGNSGAIFPPSSVPVLVMGTCITSGVRGVGHVSLLRVPGSFLEWSGINSPSAGTITAGFSGAAGADIVKIDFAGVVVLEVNSTDSFRVHNGATAVRSGYVTMIW